MADYIDREALGIGECNRDVFENKGYADGWNNAIKMLYRAPSIDVRKVKHGNWKGKPICGYTSVRCSVCDKVFAENNGKWRYCPNCGAKMDGDNGA